jgi:succinate dehydrogenase/fumarate reductase flavoprotein subunit
VNQRAVLAYARESFGMIQELESWGVKFQKTPSSDPASGYLMGTYENPANAGDGYAMAYHAGAELTNIECFQVNPLLRDYNGPACAYVSGPFGGYTVNAKGNRFMLSDYWSGQMMWEFYSELHSANGPVYLKMDHLAPETVSEIEQILHTTELRRRVNDYLQPPKSAYRLEKGLEFFERAREDLEQLGATDPHELMRANEAHFIRDCAEMAARASLLRTESRWGLYHHRLDFPEMDE